MEDRKPTVGRIVLFDPSPDDREARANGIGDGEKLPAVIVRVWSETCVNLRVLNDGESVLHRTSVTFGSGAYTWNWPERK